MTLQVTDCKMHEMHIPILVTLSGIVTDCNALQDETITNTRDAITYSHGLIEMHYHQYS